MFEYVLTTKEFYEQLASYLKDNVYKTVNVDTLFSHLEKVCFCRLFVASLYLLWFLGFSKGFFS